MPSCCPFRSLPPRPAERCGACAQVWDNLNPKFSKSFVLRYYFERTQLYKFEVYDVDDEQRRMDLSRQDLIGVTAPLALGEIVATAGGKSVPLLARDGRELGHGTLTVEGTEQQGGNDVAHLTLRGEGLAICMKARLPRDAVQLVAHVVVPVHPQRWGATVHVPGEWVERRVAIGLCFGA